MTTWSSPATVTRRSRCSSSRASEAQLLAAFPYQPNEVVLHTDTRMLPSSPRARGLELPPARQPQERVALTYNMNVLQRLTAPEVFLVTLNRSEDIEPSRVLGSYVYHHPVYTPEAVAAQRRLGEINGANRSFFCGASGAADSTKTAS